MTNTDDGRRRRELLPRRSKVRTLAHTSRGENGLAHSRQRQFPAQAGDRPLHFGPQEQNR